MWEGTDCQEVGVHLKGWLPWEQGWDAMWLEGDRERLELEGVMKPSPTQAGRVPAKLRDGGLRSASCQWHFCTCWEGVEASSEPCQNMLHCPQSRAPVEGHAS